MSGRRRGHYPDVIWDAYERLYAPMGGFRTLFATIRSAIGERPATADDVWTADPIIRAAARARHPMAEAMLHEKVAIYNWNRSGRRVMRVSAARCADLAKSPWSSPRKDVDSGAGCAYILLERSGLFVPHDSRGALPLAGVMLDFGPKAGPKDWLNAVMVGSLIAGPHAASAPALAFYVLSEFAPGDALAGNTLYGHVALPDDRDANLDEAWLEAAVAPYVFDRDRRSAIRNSVSLALKAVQYISRAPKGAWSVRHELGRPVTTFN
jgi:hypothetical protein